MPFPRSMTPTVTMRRHDSGIAMQSEKLSRGNNRSFTPTSHKIVTDNKMLYSKSIECYTEADENHPGMIRFLSEEVPADIIGHLADVMHNIWETNRSSELLRKFIVRIALDMEVDYTVVIASVIYLNKLKTKFTNTRIDTSNVSTRQMFLAALMIASKYFCDVPFTNKQWADCAQVSLEHINTLEKETLVALDYKLNIPPEMHRNVKMYFERVMHHQRVTKRQQREREQQSTLRKRAQVESPENSTTAAAVPSSKRKSLSFFDTTSSHTPISAPTCMVNVFRSNTNDDMCDRDNRNHKRHSPSKVGSYTTVSQSGSSSSFCMPLSEMPLPPMPMTVAEAAAAAAKCGTYLPKNIASSTIKRPLFPASKLDGVHLPIRSAPTQSLPVQSEYIHPSKSISREHFASSKQQNCVLKEDANALPIFSDWSTRTAAVTTHDTLDMQHIDHHTSTMSTMSIIATDFVKRHVVPLTGLSSYKTPTGRSTYLMSPTAVTTATRLGSTIVQPVFGISGSV